MSVRVPGGYNPASVAITGGNIPYTVAQSLVPVGKAGSGSMGNNGALTLTTALGLTYSNGIWLFYPAGAIAAGVPAAASFLWTVMSSTTVGTVYNSTYTTGIPVRGTQTAFVTTGPGAFTGDVSEVGITIPIGANLIGNFGQIEAAAAFSYTSSASNKTPRIRYGASGAGNTGTQYYAINRTTTTEDSALVVFGNVGVTNAQKSFTQSQGGTLGGSGEPSSSNKMVSTVDTTAASEIFISCQNAAAADNSVVEGLRIRISQGAS